jgi:hypothetical protein
VRWRDTASLAACAADVGAHTWPHAVVFPGLHSSCTSRVNKSAQRSAQRCGSGLQSSCRCGWQRMCRALRSCL